MASKIPAFSYTGSYKTELKNGRWYIFFLTSGTLRMSYSKTADLYLHGGGGGGSKSGYNSCGGSGGGGGWLANHYDVQVNAGVSYNIVIGEGGEGGYYSPDGYDGGASSAFGYSVQGGKGGTYMGSGGAGGSGNGGTRGASVGGTASKGGSNTVYAFEAATGLIYGGGGSGGAPEYGGSYAEGGSPYGAGASMSAKANTGAGGGGADYQDSETGAPGSAGGSGIVILRGSQDDYLPVKFDGTTLQRILFNGEEVAHLIHDGTQIFMERVKGWSKWSKQETLSLQPVS